MCVHVCASVCVRVCVFLAKVRRGNLPNSSKRDSTKLGPECRSAVFTYRKETSFAERGGHTSEERRLPHLFRVLCMATVIAISASTHKGIQKSRLLQASSGLVRKKGSSEEEPLFLPPRPHPNDLVRQQVTFCLRRV